MKDGQDRKSNGSPCIVGNWGSFIWPESEPDRLGLLCYLLDAGCFHDGRYQSALLPAYVCSSVSTDACEEMGIDDAHQEHLDMEAAMDVEDARTFAKDSRSLKTKQLISAAVLECIKVDRAGALRMLEAYRKKYVYYRGNLISKDLTSPCLGGCASWKPTTQKRLTTCPTTSWREPITAAWGKLSV
jgi:hypothetical protein